MGLIDTGEHEMTTCSQHGAFEKNMERRLDEIHEDIRTLTLHLIPPAQKPPSTTGGGIHVAVNASGANTTTHDARSSATEPAKPEAKATETQWTRIISLCLVIIIIGMEAGPPALAALARMWP